MKNKFPILPMLKILLLCYILTALFLAFLAFLLLKLKLPDTQLTLFAYAIYVITCFLGGFLTGKKVTQQKFMWGLLEGALYFGILLALSFAIQKEMYQSMEHMIISFALCLGGGMIGGMLS